jgi:hypothetical protein
MMTGLLTTMAKSMDLLSSTVILMDFQMRMERPKLTDLLMAMLMMKD